MNTSDETLYLQKIEEIVYDNNEIITPTLLSSKLNVSVSDAKHLMKQYIKDTEKSYPNNLKVTYVVIGENSEGKVTISLVKDDELEGRKNELKTIISEQMYSIQKSESFQISVLANLETFDGLKDVREKPLLGSIVSRNAIKRKIKPKVLEPVNKETVENRTKTENTKPKNGGGLSNFLSKQPSKQVLKPTVESKPKSTKNLMSNFLSKQSEEKKVKEEKHAENPESTSVKIEEKIVPEREPEKRKLISSDSDEEIQIPKKTKETPKQKPKKKRKNKDKGGQAVKRRRIIAQDNSDSEEIFASDKEPCEEDEDIVISDQEEPPPKQVLNYKRKVKKAVTETVMDDEGYIQTLNKFVYESASDQDDEVKEMKSNKNETEKENKEEKVNNSTQNNLVKKNLSPVKGNKNGKGKTQNIPKNQASITSFFKKK